MRRVLRRLLLWILDMTEDEVRTLPAPNPSPEFPNTDAIRILQRRIDAQDRYASIRADAEASIVELGGVVS